MTFTERFADIALQRNGEYDLSMRTAIWGAVRIEHMSVYPDDQLPPMPTSVANRAMKGDAKVKKVIAYTCNDPVVLDKLAKKGLVGLRRAIAVNPACSLDTIRYLQRIGENDPGLRIALWTRAVSLAASTPLAERGNLIGVLCDGNDSPLHMDRVVDIVSRATTDEVDNVDEKVAHLQQLLELAPACAKSNVVRWLLMYAPFTTEMTETLSQTLDLPWYTVETAPLERWDTIQINHRVRDQQALLSLLRRHSHLVKYLGVTRREPRPLGEWDPRLVETILRDGTVNCAVTMLNNNPDVVATMSIEAVQAILDRFADARIPWKAQRITPFLFSYLQSHVNMTGDTFNPITAMLEASTTDFLTTVHTLQIMFGKP